MKLIAIIMSLYIAVLSVIPCSDTASNIATSITKEWQQDHQKSEAHHDLCSPFCTCNCCRTLVHFSFQTLKLTKEYSEIKISEKVFPIYTQFFASNYYGNIWQPPKI